MRLLSRLWRLMIGALALLGFAYLAVSFSSLNVWWARKLAGPWNDPRGETLIVLAGSVMEEGIVGSNSYWRALYALRAYQEGGVRKVLIAGGLEPNPASRPMKELLACEGVPADVIVIETKSASTRENAVNAAQMLRGDSSRKVLLTSDYHMYRAWRAFRKAGIPVEPRPFPDAIKHSQHWRGRWPIFLDLCTETTKIAYYYVRGWI